MLCTVLYSSVFVYILVNNLIKYPVQYLFHFSYKPSFVCTTTCTSWDSNETPWDIAQSVLPHAGNRRYEPKIDETEKAGCQVWELGIQYHLCSTYRGFWGLGYGCLAVVAHWQSAGSSTQRYSGFDSRRLLAFLYFTMRHCEAPWSIIRQYEISWDIMRFYETLAWEITKHH